MNDYNQESFTKVKDATVAKTFYEARAILSDIDNQKITDPDLDDLVQYCKDLVNFCIKYGIQREAELNFFAILTTTDYNKLLQSTILNFALDSNPLQGLSNFVGQGSKLTFLTLTWYNDILSQLGEKYDG